MCNLKRPRQLRRMWYLMRVQLMQRMWFVMEPQKAHWSTAGQKRPKWPKLTEVAFKAWLWCLSPFSRNKSGKKFARFLSLRWTWTYQPSLIEFANLAKGNVLGERVKLWFSASEARVKHGARQKKTQISFLLPSFESWKNGHFFTQWEVPVV